MTTSDQSPFREVRRATDSFLRPKATLRLGSWNVRTMYETSKTAQVTSEMRRYNLDILGINAAGLVLDAKRPATVPPSFTLDDRTHTPVVLP